MSFKVRAEHHTGRKEKKSKIPSFAEALRIQELLKKKGYDSIVISRENPAKRSAVSGQLSAKRKRRKNPMPNPKRKKMSRAAQKRISKKIALITREEKHKRKRKRRKPAQIEAIAYSMERHHKLGPRGGHKRKRNPLFQNKKTILYLLVAGVVGYFLYKRYQDQQLTSALLAIPQTPSSPDLAVAGY